MVMQKSVSKIIRKRKKINKKEREAVEILRKGSWDSSLSLFLALR